MKKLCMLSTQVLLAAYLLIGLPVQVSASQEGPVQRGPSGTEAGCKRHRGPTGPTGAQGEVFAFISGYADATTPAGATGPLDTQIVLVGAPILFNVPPNTDVLITSSGITYNGNTGALAGTFSVKKAGLYEINYGARWAGNNVSFPTSSPIIAVEIDGNEIVDSRIAGPPSPPVDFGVFLPDFPSASVIVSITDPATQVISLVNSISSGAGVSLQLATLFFPVPLVNNPPTTSAFITIKRIQ